MNSLGFEGNTASQNQHKIFTELMHQGRMYLGQSKLCFCRALREIPGNQPRLKRVLELLTAALQFAMESAHRLGVSR